MQQERFYSYIRIIKNQLIRESCDIQPINEGVERRREWNEYVTKKDAERLVKISRDNIPAGKKKISRKMEQLVLY